MAVAHPMFMILLALSSLPASTASSKSVFGCYKSIVSFGDSLADTGNILVPGVSIGPCPAANPPYGRTFFHRPTGRYSDGRLVIDFIAQSLGLPLLKPYLKAENEEADSRNFSTGVNFAVSGAMALDYEFYKKIGYYNPYTNVSLGTQLNWFRKFLASLPDGKKYLESSLVVVGEIGGNDYNIPILEGASPGMLQSLVPTVTKYIGTTIQELIKLGAVNLLVPGNYPIGCLPSYLSSYMNSSTDSDYDSKTGCLNWLNELSIYHNELLLNELSRIRELHPHVHILYADCYGATMRLFHSPDQFGFGNRILRACCGGGGGPYNCNKYTRCGTPHATTCEDPGLYVSWDGLHYTEAAYRLVAQGLVEGPYTRPHFTTICPNSIPERASGYYEY